jgi:putative ABC transport system permease protein
VRLEHTLTMTTQLPLARYGDGPKRSAFLGLLGDRVRALPGVVSAGLTSCPPLIGACNVLFFYIEGRPYVLGNFLTAHERSVDAQYFPAAGIRLLRGRTFAPGDGVGGDATHPRTGAILISETMASRFFGGEDPIGKRIFFDFEVQRERNEGVPAPRYEIVGIVSDVLPTLDAHMEPTLYRPALDVASNTMTILVHSAGDPQSIASTVKNEVRRLDPALVVYQVRTLDDLVEQSTSSRRFTMLLFVAFAALALSLAAVGLYGVVSYAVSQRTTEIGIRMALGATSGDVNRLVVMQGLKPAVAGMAVGLAGAAVASRLLQTLLFGVTPADPLTFALVTPALLMVATLACWLPGARAARLNPTAALRAE